ncbi:unnamed protein product, partial [Allacma fusca]
FAAEKKSVFETGGGKNDVFVSEEGLQIHAIVGPQIDPLDNLFDDDADVISLNGDNKENSNPFSVKALKAANLEISVTDSSDDDNISFKSVPKCFNYGSRRITERTNRLLVKKDHKSQTNANQGGSNDENGRKGEQAPLSELTTSNKTCT